MLKIGALTYPCVHVDWISYHAFIPVELGGGKRYPKPVNADISTTRKVYANTSTYFPQIGLN
jgi:hypothetical protein